MEFLEGQHSQQLALHVVHIDAIEVFDCKADLLVIKVLVFLKGQHGRRRRLAEAWGGL